jgi:AcrR family transcriptional regulator
MGTSTAGREPAAPTAPDRPRGKGTPSQAEIVTAALAFIDTHGLDKFSVSALAAELGMFQPHVYRRVASRQQLLDLVVDQIMTEVGAPDVEPSQWHAWLLDWGARVRRAWQRHPRAGALIYHGDEASRSAMDRVLGVLLASFPDDVVVVAGKAYLSYVFGATLLEVRALSAGEPPDPGEAPPAASPYRNIQEFARLEVNRGTTEEAAERDFLQGLSILLDGFRAHAAKG